MTSWQIKFTCFLPELRNSQSRIIWKCILCVRLIIADSIPSNWWGIPSDLLQWALLIMWLCFSSKMQRNQTDLQINHWNHWCFLKQMYHFVRCAVSTLIWINPFGLCFAYLLMSVPKSFKSCKSPKKSYKNLLHLEYTTLLWFKFLLHLAKSTTNQKVPAKSYQSYLSF